MSISHKKFSIMKEMAKICSALDYKIGDIIELPDEK